MAFHGPAVNDPLIQPQPSTIATRAGARVALVTCAALGGLDPDDALLLAPLAARGIAAVPAVWDDPTVDWSGYDLVVPRSTWDYPDRRDVFVRWAHAVGPRLANPAEVLAWNTDKTYLTVLSDAGLPVVPTTWVPPGSAWDAPVTGEVVVKPAVGAGSIDTGRYDLAERGQHALAVALVARLHAAGRTVMVQPYLAAVDSHGETALLYLGGRYSHAVRKAPMLDGPATALAGLYRPETITPREPSAAELAVAERVLSQAPGPLLYARVDLIPDADGAPLLVELELAEPSLFLGTAPGAADRFADAIVDVLR